MFDLLALKAAMAQREMGVFALAAAAGVNYSSLIGILNHGKKPTAKTIGRLAKALDVEPRTLFKEGKE